MKPILLLICCLTGWLACAVSASADTQKLKVVEPFIQLYTGPGTGYPVLQDVPRGGWLTILKHQAGWFKVQTARGKTGWVQKDELEKTVTAQNEAISLPGVSQDDFSQRNWEIGTLWGETDGAEVFTLYTAYAFNENLSVELSGALMLGNLSESYLGNLNLVAQPFPEWRVTPFFTLGTGVIITQTRSTLVEQRDQLDNTSHFGAGVRAYLSRSFFLRLEYREYIVFSSSNDNEELAIWSIGVGSFF